jgi:hypothetical protein
MSKNNFDNPFFNGFLILLVGIVIYQCAKTSMQSVPPPAPEGHISLLLRLQILPFLIAMSGVGVLLAELIRIPRLWSGRLFDFRFSAVGISLLSAGTALIYGVPKGNDVRMGCVNSIV